MHSSLRIASWWLICGSTLLSAHAQETERRSVDQAPAADARVLEEQRALEERRARVSSALLAALSNPNASALSLPTAGAPFAAGFWSEHTGQFVSFGLEQSSVRFTGASGAAADQGEWLLGFDQLPRRVVAREFADGVVVAAAAVTIDAQPRTAVAWLQWMPSDRGGLELRSLGHTVIRALRLASGESVDAAQISDFEVADWDPRTRQGLLLAPVWGTGEVVAIAVPFEGRAPRSPEVMTPRGVLVRCAQEELASTTVARGRDVRVARHGGRLFAALRTVEAPTGGFIGSAQLPLALHERDESGAWRPVATRGPAPRVGADYALWSDGEGLRATTLSASSGAAREALTHSLGFGGAAAPHWSEEVARRAVDQQLRVGVNRLEVAAPRAGARLVLVDAQGARSEVAVSR